MSLVISDDIAITELAVAVSSARAERESCPGWSRHRFYNAAHTVFDVADGMVNAFDPQLVQPQY